VGAVDDQDRIIPSHRVGGHRWTRVPPAGIPPELRPRWRDLPLLIWTMARADAPDASPLGVPCAELLLYAPTIVGAQASGALASHEPNALLIVVLNPSRWLRLLRTTATAATAAIIWALWFAVPYLTVPSLAGRIARGGFRRPLP
jgi:hypothetical protein